MTSVSHPLVGATAGSIGAVVALALTYPLKVLKQRLQADSTSSNVNAKNASDGEGAKYTGAINCAAKTIRKEGVSGLYAGVALALPNTAVWNFVFYFFFSLLRPIWERRDGRRQSILRSIAHGMSAGIGTQLVMLPLDAVNIRRTVQVSKRTSGSTTYLEVVRDLYDEGGVFGFWKGLVPGLLLTINPGIVQMVRKFLTEMRSRSRRRQTNSMENFWIGLCAKLIASAITYPLVVAKVVMTVSSKKQKKRNGHNDSSRESSPEDALHFLRIWASIVETNGWRGLYKGIPPHLTQAALKAGILNAVRLKILATALWVLSSGGSKGK